MNPAVRTGCLRSRGKYAKDALMKQYVIDELRDRDVEKLAQHLTERFGPAMLDRVYWVPLDPEFYTAVQASHEDCHPLYFALQLKPGALVGEFLIRTHQRMRCSCMAYANEAQRGWLISLMDDMIRDLNITV